MDNNKLAEKSTTLIFTYKTLDGIELYYGTNNSDKRTDV